LAFWNSIHGLNIIIVSVLFCRFVLLFLSFFLLWCF